MEIARTMKRDEILVICLSGRGDKDAAEIARLRELRMT
jgi:tryptophan synthase beta chain